MLAHGHADPIAQCTAPRHAHQPGQHRRLPEAVRSPTMLQTVALRGADNLCLMNAAPSPGLTSEAASVHTSSARDAYDAYLAQHLSLNMQRGQPSAADFDLSNEMLQIVGPGDVTTKDGLDA